MQRRIYISLNWKARRLLTSWRSFIFFKNKISINSFHNMACLELSNFLNKEEEKLWTQQ